MKRFYIDKDVSVTKPITLTGSDAKHLGTVLRAQPGDGVVLFDENGWEYRASILSVSPRAVEVSVVEKHRSAAESPAGIAIGQALLKGRKMDRIVRHLTELGVSAFLPFFAQRSVSRLDERRLAERKERWEKIAREALKQCGRYTCPEIGMPRSLKALLGQTDTYDGKWIFHYEAPSRTAAASESTWSPKTVSAIALVGPEGGFSPAELEMAHSHGFTSVRLGPRVLKADTAAVAIATMVQWACGDLGGLPGLCRGKRP